jgi:hypothetical protein
VSRLLIPLAIITAAIWGVIYAMSGKTRRTSAHYLKEFLLSLALAAAVLAAISAMFYLGGFVNAS